MTIKQQSRTCLPFWGFQGVKRIVMYVVLGIFVFPAMSCTTVEATSSDVSREFVPIVTDKEISRIINCASKEETTQWGSHVTELSAAIFAPPEEVWALLTDYEKYIDFVPGATSYKVLKRSGNEVTVETHGVKKVKVIFTINKKLEATIKYQENKNEFNLTWDKQTSNINLNRGTWKLEPIKRNGKTYTLATHIIYSEPNTKEKLAGMIGHIEQDEVQIIRVLREMLEK